MNKTNIQGVYIDRRKLFTENLVKGEKVYGERLVRDKGREYREWDHTKSKLGAAISNGLRETGISTGSKVLYLGAASGTTPSHVSDIVKGSGVVFCVEFAVRVLRDLVFLCDKRKNLIPLMADANHPERYLHNVPLVDVVYQDVAQKNQTEIFIKNCKVYLRKEGTGILALKARSVDVAKNPSEVFADVEVELRKNFQITEKISLEPHEKDHILYMCRLKKTK